VCGITGMVDFGDRSPDAAMLEAMTASLRHRGPDNAAHVLLPPAGLGHTRLSIIDLSSAANQPMVSDDGAFTIVFNGEIYNFRDLRRELESAGVGFRTHSDTEVTLLAFRRWGEEAFARLNGMFALAIWDTGRRRLTLARDRFGIKPLYCHHDGTWLSFGSEIKALLATGRVRRRVDPQALHEYLYYGAPLGSRSLYAGVTELLPGHCATFDASAFRARPYARLEDHRPVDDDVPTATAEVARLLDHSVERHLIADVPVGVFLSGGIDSSTLTALASRHYSGRLRTYSVAFDFQPGEGELPRARQVATRFGTDHHELRVSTRNITETIESLVSAHDEPFGDAANIPLYLLAEQLRGTIKVVLQGDGGDELFGGYRRHALLRWNGAWWALARLLPPALAAALPLPGHDRIARLVAAFAPADPALRMALLLTDETMAAPPTRLLSTEALRRIEGTDPFLRYREMNARFAVRDPVDRMLHTDCSIILPDIYLEKVDRSTMAHGLEVRVPMLDKDLAAYVMGLPSQYKVRGVEKKWILRRAMRGVLPDAILDAPKHGFGVPFETWLRKPLASYLKAVLLDGGVARSGFFEPAVLERTIAEHTSGRREHGFLLWKALHLELWFRRYGIEPLAA
jgi:asparagine synthase (glutamine-hydrolysing)